MDPSKANKKISKHEDKINIKGSEKHVLLRRIAPCENTAKIYENDKAFLQELYAFVSEGLNAGEGIVVIATSSHLLALESELRTNGFDIFNLTLLDRYIKFNAESLLEKFLVEKWPDPVLFKHQVMNLAARVLKHDRNVRVFSEMAAILWLKGYRAASVQLELTWNKLVQESNNYKNVKLKSEILPPPPDGESGPPASFLKF